MRKTYDEYGNESEFGGIDWGALLGVQNDPVGGMMSAAQVIPQVIPQVAQQASKSGLGFNVPTTMVQNQPASGISPPVRGAGYVPLANGTILTPQQVQEMISYMQARTPDYGEGDLNSFLARSGVPIIRGDPRWNPNKPQSEGVISQGMQGWERGMSQDAAREAGLVGADILGGRNITVFDIAGDQYKTPQGGYGNGQGDAGFHYGLSQNPDGTFTVNSSDYSGGYAAQREDQGSTFNLGEFLPQAGMLAAIAAYAPQLAAQMGGGAIGGAGAGAIAGMGSAAVTGQDVLKGGLLGGLGGGIGGYASGLNGGANAYGQSMADGSTWGTTAVRDGILPSASQLVNTAGKAGVGMLAGQDASQALTGAGLNLAGITGNNTLKDAGLDPRLAGVATGAGLGLLTGRDPTSIALSSLPALGSYAGGLLGSSNGTPAQSNSNLSNSAEGGYASPMTGGDSPDTTGANNMGFDWTKIFGGNTIPPAGNNPDEWSSPFYDPSPFSDFNMSDYLPSDFGGGSSGGDGSGYFGGLFGADGTTQPSSEDPSGSYFGDLSGGNYDFGDYFPSLDNLNNSNTLTGNSIGNLGSNTMTGAGSTGSQAGGLAGLLASLGLGGAAAGTAGGVGLGTLLGGALGLGGAYLQGNAATNAANTNANAQIEAAKIAADAAKFRPIGITTRFGSSNFTKDANGNVTGAGYNLSPEMLAQQNQLMGISGNALTQFGNAQTATAPMGDAAGRMMTLGNQYLATSPQAQAQKYMAEQQALLATGRERDLNQMLTGEFNRGTYGLSTGGTSTGMNGANPRLEAMFNAQRQQDLGLASQATQGGMDYAKFGAGMVGSGGDMLRGMYGVQSAAYDPYKTALGGATMIEGLGQNALDSGVNMGKMTSNAQSGQLLAQGMSNAANTMQQANSYSPWGGLLSGASNQMQNYQNQQAQQAQNAQMQGMLSRIWGS